MRVLIRSVPLCVLHTGTVAGAFSVGACASANLRDRDDYKNAVVGGVLAGSIFGLKCEFQSGQVSMVALRNRSNVYALLYSQIKPCMCIGASI